MRALAVLFSILLLAFLTHAEPLRESTDEPTVQEQPEAQDQDMAISFVGNEGATREASGPQQRSLCYCRSTCCYLGELYSGTCRLNGYLYRFCCS
nr:defensin alpha 5-like [Dasypus novemcinctus]